MGLIKNKKQIALLLAISTISGIVAPTIMNLSTIESFAYSDIYDLSEEEKNELNIREIVSGSNSTFFLKSDGTVWACGRNDYGQLGVGNIDNQSSPVKVNITDVKDVVLGDYNTFFIKENGTVWATGFNSYGELGLGYKGRQLLPIQVSITDVKKIVLSNYHVFFLKKDGTVWGCGSNSVGQLGIGNTVDQLSPIQVPVTNIEEIVCNLNYVFYLKSDGTVWGCGYNSFGALGIGDTITQLSPTQISVTNVRKIICNNYSTYFLKNDGTVWGTGANTQGQLGIGNFNQQSLPIQTNISDVKNLYWGDSCTYYIKNDGTVWATGYNSSGQLGIGNFIRQSSPIQVNIADVKNIIIGVDSTFFLKSNGTIWSTGNNVYGQLGIGSNTKQSSPIQVNIADVKNIINGENNTFFFKNDGTVWVTGKNTYGQLGIGNTTNQSTPVQSNISDVKNAFCDKVNTIFIKNDGTIWVCGFNNYGQLGVGNKDMQLTPIQMNTFLYNIEDLVLKAEQTKQQVDLDFAKAKVDEITDLTQKIDLQNRLNILQIEINNIKSATNLTLKAESSLLQSDFDKAQNTINLITDNKIKTELQNRLDNIKNQIIQDDVKYNKKLQDTIDKMLKAENSKTNFDITVAQTAINNLKESDKPAFQQRLDAVKEQIRAEQEIINYNKQLQEATDKVTKAENSKIDYDITVAQGLIDKLKSEDKAPLQIKLDNLKEQIRLEQEVINYNKLLQDAILKVAKAEETKNNYDITIAKDAINKLKDIDKRPLQDRIDILEYNILLEDANLKVLSAEELRTDTSISIAQIAVDKVPLKEVEVFNFRYIFMNIIEFINPFNEDLVGKAQLQNKLDNLRLSIEEERYLKLLQEANDNVTNAESSKTLKDIKLAQMTIDRLKEIDKTPLQERLDALNLLIAQEEKEIQDLKLATTKVEQAEATKIQKDIDDAKSLVNSLKNSQEKSDLLDRINAIEQIIIIANIKTWIYQADVYVKQAEALKREPYITKAQTAIDKLPTCEEKTLLQARLDKVKK